MRKSIPGNTPSSREQQIVSAAINLAEEKILNGTASSQLITFCLQRGSPLEELKRKKLEKEIELLEAKKKALDSEKTTEELYRNAIKAMQRYSGLRSDEDDDEDDY